jgi:hypothetical protein
MSLVASHHGVFFYFTSRNLFYIFRLFLGADFYHKLLFFWYDWMMVADYFLKI